MNVGPVRLALGVELAGDRISEDDSVRDDLELAISGSWALARDLRIVTVRRRRESERRYCSRMTLSERCEIPYSARRPTS
jgi:hypothetical protein